MALLPLRQVDLPAAVDRFYGEWLEEIDDRLSAADSDWYRLARDLLFQIYYPGHTDYEGMLRDPKLPAAARASLLALDPHHITLEPEYYAECDDAKYARVKPLLWLWQAFDRSPMGGGNVHLGVRLRRMLARRIFACCGENFKCFQFVDFSFGYNLEVGDDVVVHRHVLLDDRGGIKLGNRVSVSDYANIY
ncbi:MAG: acetyltransferase, partial [Gemmatimonadales bacterium]